MTTLIRAANRAMPSVDLGGVAWPLNKVAALLGGLVAAVLAFSFGASGITAAWLAVGVALAAWWGGYAWYGQWWDHGRREYAADSTTEF